MGFGDAVRSFFSNYANFDGRARRSAVLWLLLFDFLVSAGIGLLGGLVGDPGILVGLWHVVVFVPWIALWARRLHDIGMSGWWQLLFLIPFIGFVMMIIWLILDSAPGNRWGPPANLSR